MSRFPLSGSALWKAPRRTGSSFSIADQTPEFNGKWPENGGFWPIRCDSCHTSRGLAGRAAGVRYAVKYQSAGRLRDLTRLVGHGAEREEADEPAFAVLARATREGDFQLHPGGAPGLTRPVL